MSRPLLFALTQLVFHMVVVVAYLRYSAIESPIELPTARPPFSGFPAYSDPSYDVQQPSSLIYHWPLVKHRRDSCREAAAAIGAYFMSSSPQF